MARGKRQGRQNAWYTSELVVTLEHRAEVLRVLDGWGVRFQPPTGENESQDLGLALVPFFDDEAAAAAAVAGLAREAAEDGAVATLVEKATGRAGAAPGLDEALDARPEPLERGMDRILWALRTHFAARYAGWMPTLGKNRLGGDVEGGDGQIAHSIGPPQRSAWRPAEIRRTEPGAGVRVGVLDTSLYAHPWLAGALVGPREDFLAERSEYPVEAGHGTFVAGLVLQRAPGCTIEFRKVLSEEEGTATSWDVAKRIVEVGRGGLDVLNLSLGCYTEDGQPPLLLSTAIDRLDPGIVVVAAAGNHGDVEEISDEEKRKPAWPAALDDVIAVGSTDADGFPSSFTPHDVPWIDVYARGEKVRSTYLETRAAHVDGVDPSVKLLRFDGWAEWSGTSFAAALVSGAIAAKTSPGRLSARAAWQELLDEAPVLRREVQAKLEEQGRHAEVRTRFLRVFETTDRPGDHSCGRGPVPPAGSAQQPDGKVGRRGSRILGRKRPGPS